MVEFKIGNVNYMTSKQADFDRLSVMTNYWTKATQKEFERKCFEFTIAVFRKAGKSFNGVLFAPTEIIDWLSHQPCAKQFQQRRNSVNVHIHNNLFLHQQQMHIDMMNQQAHHQMAQSAMQMHADAVNAHHIMNYGYPVM